MAKVLEFDNYAPDRFARLRVILAAKGLTVSGMSGEIKAFDADVDYAYDAAEQKLTLTVNKAPFLHNLSSFSEQLHQAIENQS